MQVQKPCSHKIHNYRDILFRLQHNNLAQCTRNKIIKSVNGCISSYNDVFNPLDKSNLRG